MATIEAIDRRRRNRASASALKAHRERERLKKYGMDPERLARQREITAKMLRRFFPEGSPYLICATYEYWQARKCGWDPLAPEFSIGDDGRPMARDADGLLVDPSAGVVWRWWMGELDYQQRRMLAEGSTFRLVRG